MRQMDIKPKTDSAEKSSSDSDCKLEHNFSPDYLNWCYISYFMSEGEKTQGHIISLKY